MRNVIAKGVIKRFVKIVCQCWDVDAMISAVNVLRILILLYFLLETPVNVALLAQSTRAALPLGT